MSDDAAKIIDEIVAGVMPAAPAETADDAAKRKKAARQQG